MDSSHADKIIREIMEENELFNSVERDNQQNRSCEKKKIQAFLRKIEEFEFTTGTNAEDCTLLYFKQYLEFEID